MNLNTKSERFRTVVIAASPMEWAESIMPSIMMEGLENRQMKEVQVEVAVIVVLGLCCGGCGVRSVVLGLNCGLVRICGELVCVA